MKYLSVCSGIEAASVAWHPLGWRAIAFSEIEPFPCAVLNYHYPDVENWGNLEALHDWPKRSDVDVLVGGTPCQSFSVAGLCKGLDDPRGNLALAYLACVERYRPRWVVWENVPGVLSSDDGRAMGAFIGGLAELGYGYAWRVLDAQYFGVPQRRRRVFVVGYSGDWRPPFGVLFEPESMRRDSAPSREAGQRVAPSLAARTQGGGGLGTDTDCDGGLISMALNAGSMGRQDAETETLIPFDLFQITAPINRQNRKPGDPCHTLAHDNAAHAAVVFDARQSDAIQYGDRAGPLDTCGYSQGVAHSVCLGSDPIHNNDVAMPQTGRNGDPGVVQAGRSVRRLTPRECERLQGFPDDYTLVPYRNGWAKDGPRYKALGNAFAVPVVRWLGERINLMESVLDDREGEFEQARQG